MSATVCPLCRTAAARPLFTLVVRCLKCGLVRTQLDTPVATLDVDQVYGQDYFTARNAYLSNSPAFAGMFERLLNIVQGHVASGRLLDVGCGPGLLLSVARRRGYTVFGCDVSAWAAQHARDLGFDVMTGPLESLRYPSGQFDVVIVNHTLEHVPGPVELLSEARRILSDEGVLVVGAPNFGSLLSQLMRGRWAGLLPDQHLWHFTRHTLRLMLEQTGFAIRDLRDIPTVHHHPNPLKRIVLLGITTSARLIRRSDGLLAVARKYDPHV